MTAKKNRTPRLISIAVKFVLAGSRHASRFHATNILLLTRLFVGSMFPLSLAILLQFEAIRPTRLFLHAVISLSASRAFEPNIFTHRPIPRLPCADTGLGEVTRLALKRKAWDQSHRVRSIRQTHLKLDRSRRRNRAAPTGVGKLRRRKPGGMKRAGGTFPRPLNRSSERRELRVSDHSRILVTTPAPTVLPPSRIAKRRLSSMAIEV